MTGDGGTLGAGYIGQGTLTIADGKIVTSLVGYLGYQSGSNGVGTITGAGSQWKLNSRLNVGSGGTGTLTVSSGAQLNTFDATIGKGNCLRHR